MSKPNLFILGAPKCGTTSLYTYLKDHPQIYMSPAKEPHYFNKDSKNRRFKELIEYEKLFFDVPDIAEYLGEASTWYLFSKTAVPNILSYNSDSKFIVMLRNPIEMAPSLHKQHLYTHVESVTNFKEAWDLQDRRKEGEKIPKHCRDKSMLLYGPVCKLGHQLERLYKNCNKENVLVLFLDDLKKDPAKLIKCIENFLGIKKWVPKQFPVANAATTNASSTIRNMIIHAGKIKRKLNINFSLGVLNNLSNLNSKNESWSIDDKMKEKILEYFYDDINLIETITGANLNHWKHI